MRFTGVLVAAVAVVASLPGAATAVPSARLLPADLTIRLEAGQSQSVHYALEMPAQPPRPTDVHFLVDTGASMQRHVQDVRYAVHDVMRLFRGSDVMVGVAEFRTTSVADWHDGLTYRVLRKVGPIDSGLEYAVNRLGNDQARLPQLPLSERAHALALDQTVTGAGHAPYAAPGQDAGFRPAARKVVVVVTDSAFAQDSTQPSRDEAIAALRAARVEVFGLALGGSALGDLTALAAGTGSTADKTVDCGNGRRVAAGRPTACVVAPRMMGRALTAMLYERRPATLTVSATGKGVRRLAPRAWTVDRGQAVSRTTRLDVTCAASDAGRSHVINLYASVSGTRVARAVVTLECVRAG